MISKLLKEVEEKDLILIKKEIFNQSEIYESISSLKVENDFLNVIKNLHNFSEIQKEELLTNLVKENLDEGIVVFDDQLMNPCDLIYYCLKQNYVQISYFETLTEELRNEKKKLKLAYTIVKHLKEAGKIDVEFFKNLLEFYPEYVYMGYGYRVVLLKDGKEFDESKIKPGSSWALSIEGLNKFLEHENSNHKESVYLEANIVGLNLVRLIKEQFPFIEDIREEMKELIKEEEIIATEILGIGKIIKNFNY